MGRRRSRLYIKFQAIMSTTPGRTEHLDEQLTRSVRELEDIRYALDQSAIVATTDVSGKIKYVNDKFCEISKYSRDDLLGQDHRILNSAHHPKDCIRELWRTIAQGRVWRGELRNRAKDGSLYWVDTTIVPFLDSHKHPWQYMAIRYDITERKRQEAQLREQATLARLGEMAAVVAHEVRNPLAGIRGALQVIASRLPEHYAREVGVLREVVLRVDGLNDIVEDLLVFARQRELRLANVSVRPLLINVAAWLKQDESMSGVQVDVDSDDLVIAADAEQLREVLSNLLLNAAQAMEHQGRIVLTGQRRENSCRIEVRDEGPGIPEDVRERIFDPFFTTKTRGTGLGLPTAKRIIDMHGGAIDIDCPPAGGTVVRVTLPVPQPRSEA
jgi:PAS domain S-box-containing protein